MADKAKKAKVTTGTFRVSFPHVFKPQTTPNGDQRYSVVMLFPSDDKASIKKLKALAKSAAHEKWGKELVEAKKIKVNMPFRDGEEKSHQYDGYEGCVFATASSKNQPNVVDQQMEKIVDASEFYPGCYARASVNAYAWEWKGKKGVSFGLINLQKVKDGEPFGMSSNPEDGLRCYRSG